ncbi:M23 family metallopeptidase [bacterium]|nr:M23 family metallopeptidase [bacterium]
MKNIFSIFLLLSVVVSSKAGADIYRHVSNDGVECYTDAPVNRESVVVIREYRKVKEKSNKTVSTKSIKTRNTPMVLQPASLSSTSRVLSLPVAGVVTSVVGFRNDPIDGVLRNHKGVDVAIPEGTPIKPVAPGTIMYSGTRGGYGNIVIVEHAGGMTTLYAHNSFNLAATGNRVDKSSTIALSGSTGRSTGPHLHFEAWLEGQNITTDFLADPTSIQRYSVAKRTVRKINAIRKVVMADGSIYLTNLPLVHP